MGNLVQIRNDQMVDLLKADFVMGLVPIAQTTLTGSVASVTFSSIPAIFRTLLMVCQARTDRVAEGDSLLLQFNGDAGNNYDYILAVITTGGITTSGVIATGGINIGNTEGANSRAANWSPFEIWMPGYALADREKWAECHNAGQFGNVSAITDLNMIPRRGRWRNTAAVSSITLLSSTASNFVSGCVFALYGVV